MAGYSEHRFWGQWRHLHRSGNHLFGAHVDLLRDDMILRDFEQDYGIRSLPYLVSTIWGGFDHGRGSVRLEGELVDDLNDQANNDALHTLPHLRISGTRLRGTPQ